MKNVSGEKFVISVAVTYNKTYKFKVLIINANENYYCYLGSRGV